MRRLITLAAGATLILAACGGDDDDDASATTVVVAVETTAVDTAAPATTAPATTAAAGPTTAAAPDTTAAAPATTDGPPTAAADADPQVDAAALAWTTVFDSATTFDQKAPHLEVAADLRPTIDAYAATGTQMGGITLVPTDVVVADAAATITYDIHIAGQEAYGGQAGTVTLRDGTWIVTRDEFCAFMALARTACPA